VGLATEVRQPTKERVADKLRAAAAKASLD